MTIARFMEIKVNGCAPKNVDADQEIADTAADAAQRLGTHAQIGGQFPQGNKLQHVGTTLRQGLVALLRRGGIAVQQAFVNLGQHVFASLRPSRSQAASVR